MLTDSEKEKTVRLYVIYHQNILLPNIPALSFIRSDIQDGDHIAERSDYAELRAQYYIWKNQKSDYVGFFQYRRYLECDTGKLVCSMQKKRPVPYRILRSPEPSLYTSSKINSLVSICDAIVPVWEYTGISVRSRYGKAKMQRLSDLKLIEKILFDKYPGYVDAAELYLAGMGEYYGNIFIMRWDIFDAYCRWLFDILEEFDRRVKDPLPRADAYLGERLLGIYFTWLRQQPKFYCGELPRMHFYGYDDEQHHFRYEKFCNFLLPPGSERRTMVRKIFFHLTEEVKK